MTELVINRGDCMKTSERVGREKEEMSLTKHQTFLKFDTWCESTKGLRMEGQRREKEGVR